jgi:hypothetical protein
MQRQLQEAMEVSGARLTLRAQALVLLILDALEDEPLRGWSDESDARRHLVQNVDSYLPDLLRELYKTVDRGALDTLTVFDILHNFETVMSGWPRNQFFPGKL